MEKPVGKTKICKHCKENIDIKAKKCPNCGGKQGIPKWIIVVIVVFVLIAVVSAGGKNNSSKPKTNNDTKTNSDTKTTTPEKKEKFSHTIDKSYVGDYNMGYYIEGTVKNNEDKDYSYVQIEFVCYDAAGNNLGTALDNTNNLLANQTWKYKAMFMDQDGDKVDHCDYHEITGH